MDRLCRSRGGGKAPSGSTDAVLKPDGSEYLYFVAKDARNHAFARTYEEHKRNVERYMK